MIYRRPDAVPLRPGGARPVQAELVDGRPVYRIYRPRAPQSVYSPAHAVRARADHRAADRGHPVPIRTPRGRAAAYRAHLAVAAALAGPAARLVVALLAWRPG